MEENTVLGQILENCRNAVLRGKPVLILRTSEIELVRDIIESDQLVVRLSKDNHKGADEEEVIPTRFIQPAPVSKLFRTGRQSSRRINFNIHYCREEQLKYFTEETSGHYGEPCLNQGGAYPCLYLIQYPCAAPDKNPLETMNLNAFLDRFLQEKLTNSALSSSLIIIYGENAQVPPVYQNYCEIIEEPFPSAGEIQELLYHTGFFHPEKDKTSVNATADLLLGLPFYHVERIIQSLCVMPLAGKPAFLISDEKAVKKEIQKRKEQVLKKDHLLELIPVEQEENGPGFIHSMIGGMNNFKAWMRAQEPCIRESSRLKREMGAFPPKGVLLCGIPGCGKSLAVQAAASLLKIPLLKMDIGQLMGKYVGESEHNMIKALRIVEAMSPCILFLDELDKGFGTMEDSGPFKRMFATLLGWMQDCQKTCFIFATANQISSLPKEFFRSGRFDCMYSLYMPTAEECTDIFEKQMGRADREVSQNNHATYPLFAKECYDPLYLQSLMNIFAEQERFVTGADIAKIVNMSLRSLWNKGLSGQSISWPLWKSQVMETLSQTSVYGDGKENIDSIAVSYVRLLRNNFLPASENPMFRSQDYQVRRKKTPAGQKNDLDFPDYEVTLAGYQTPQSAYDAKFQQLLLPKIEEYGALIEKYEFKKVFS